MNNSAAIPLYTNWVKLSDLYFKSDSVARSNFGLLNNLQFRSLFNGAPSVLYVINHAEQKYEYVSDNMKYFLGYAPLSFYEQGLKFGLSLFHPDHACIYSGYIFPAMFEAINKYKADDNIKKLSFYYTCKTKRNDGVYVWVSKQMSIMEVDSFGNPLLSMVFMNDINPVREENEVIDFIIYLNDENGHRKTILHKQYKTNPDEILTLREQEILVLLSEGKCTKEIAERLSISHHTVYTHRKNMLQKMSSKNMVELLHKMRLRHAA